MVPPGPAAAAGEYDRESLPPAGAPATAGNNGSHRVSSFRGRCPSAPLPASFFPWAFAVQGALTGNPGPGAG